MSLDAGSSALEAPTKDTRAQLEVECIEPSPTNPRKVFDKAKLEELAESYPRVGILHALTVRKHPKPHGKITHQLCLGERRWRAAKIAKLPKVPIRFVDWTDDQVFEAQLIENAERTDLTPIEEADTYAAMLTLPGYTEERIADRIGRPLEHVKERLRLAALQPAVREQLVAGKFGIAIALLIARVPPSLQAAAAKAIAQGKEEKYYNEAEDKWFREARPVTIREAQSYLRKEFMLPLAQAPFAPDDATLVPKVGACTTCPKRTGNQPELFADIKKPDVCTDPGCYKEKTDADFKRKAEAAKKTAATEGKKVEVLPAAEVKKVLTGRVDHDTGQTRTDYNSSYAALDEDLPYELKAKAKGKKTWGDLVAGADVAKVLAKDPNTGAARELVSKKDALAGARKAGLVKKEKAPPKQKTSAEMKREQAERDRKKLEELRTGVVGRTLAAIAEGKAPAAKSEAAFWRWVARLVAYGMMDGADVVMRRRGVTVKQTWNVTPEVEKTIDKISAAPAARGLALELLVACVANGDDEFSPKVQKLVDEGCKLLGIDQKAIAAAAEKAAEAEDQLEKAKAGKKARRG